MLQCCPAVKVCNDKCLASDTRTLQLIYVPSHLRPQLSNSARRRVTGSIVDFVGRKSASRTNFPRRRSREKDQRSRDARVVETRWGRDRKLIACFAISVHTEELAATQTRRTRFSTPLKSSPGATFPVTVAPPEWNSRKIKCYCASSLTRDSSSDYRRH